MGLFLLSASLMMSCGGNKTEKESNADSIAVSDEAQEVRDTTLYGVSGQFGMSTFTLITDAGDTLYVMDQISDKKNKEENWVEKLSLSDAMKKLAKREHEIITLRFFEGKTQMEVATIIGISQAQVSRLEKNALKIMRGYLS